MPSRKAEPQGAAYASPSAPLDEHPDPSMKGTAKFRVELARAPSCSGSASARLAKPPTCRRADLTLRRTALLGRGSGVFATLSKRHPRRANVVRTSACPRASTRGSLFGVGSLGLPGFRGRDDPVVPALPGTAPGWYGGVDGSSPSEGFAETKIPGNRRFWRLADHHRAPPLRRRDRSRARPAIQSACKWLL